MYFNEKKETNLYGTIETYDILCNNNNVIVVNRKCTCARK